MKCALVVNSTGACRSQIFHPFPISRSSSSPTSISAFSLTHSYYSGPCIMHFLPANGTRIALFLDQSLPLLMRLLDNSCGKCLQRMCTIADRKMILQIAIVQNHLSVPYNLNLPRSFNPTQHRLVQYPVITLHMYMYVRPYR